MVTFFPRLVFSYAVGPPIILIPLFAVLGLLIFMRRSVRQRDPAKPNTGELWRPGALFLRLPVAAVWIAFMLQQGQFGKLFFWLPIILYLVFTNPVTEKPALPALSEPSPAPPPAMVQAPVAEGESVTFPPLVGWVLAGLGAFALGVAGLLAWFVLPLLLVDMVMKGMGMPAQGQGEAAGWVLMASCPMGAVIGFALGLWSNGGSPDRGRRYVWSLGILTAMSLAIFAWVFVGIQAGERETREMCRRNAVSARSDPAKMPRPPLFAAVESGNGEPVKELLEKGENVDQRDAYGNTPLIMAANWPNYEAAKLLLENGADVNATAKLGGTPILMAVMRGDARIVSLLLEKGADTSGRLSDYYRGGTLLDAAVRCPYEGKSEVIALLQKHGVKADHMPPQPVTVPPPPPAPSR